MFVLTLMTACAMSLVSCATIMQGSRQQISISSTPSGASLVIDSGTAIRTPYVAKLKRKDTHTIRIELAGYKPFELITSRGTSGWVWGNIVFGGVLGLIVDADGEPST
jgi:hypothetical protein